MTLHICYYSFSLILCISEFMACYLNLMSQLVYVTFECMNFLDAGLLSSFKLSYPILTSINVFF